MGRLFDEDVAIEAGALNGDVCFAWADPAGINTDAPDDIVGGTPDELPASGVKDLADSPCGRQIRHLLALPSTP